MSDDEKQFIEIGVYSMVILLYAWWAIFMAAFYDVFPFAYLVVILFFFYILFGQLATVSFLKVNMSDVEDGKEPDKKDIGLMIIFLGYGVYLNGLGVRQIGNYISSFHTKFYYIVYPIKAAFLILYIILFAFYLDNAFRIIAYIFFFIMMLIVTVFRFNWVYGIWSLLSFLVLALGSTVLQAICFPCQCFKLCGKGKKEINEKEEKKEQNENKLDNQLNIELSLNVDEHSHKLPPALNNQFDDLSIPADQENQLKLNEIIKETQKVKTMKDINEQKNKSCSSSTFGVICKNKFENGETTVEIECGVFNKMHTKGIDIGKDYYCSYGNTNLAELTAKLQPSLPAHTEDHA